MARQITLKVNQLYDPVDLANHSPIAGLALQKSTLCSICRTLNRTNSITSAL